MARVIRRPALLPRWSFHGRVYRHAGGWLMLTALMLWGCADHDTLEGFWGYPWGTTRSDVLRDSAQIEHRLSDTGFGLERQPRSLQFYRVQYGMGYDRVRLDFTEHDRLWHGHVRVLVNSKELSDSIVASWHARYGRASADRRIGRPGGFTTLWRTNAWVDRDFYAEELSPEIDPASVRAIDLFAGGCLTCPLYSLRLYPDGRALLRSLRGDHPEGGFLGTWNAEAFVELALDVTRPEFLGLSGYYADGIRGGRPATGVRVEYGDDFELWSESADSAGPPQLENMLLRLRGILDRIEWTGQLVSWDTVGMGQEALITLDSLATLARRGAR